MDEIELRPTILDDRDRRVPLCSPEDLGKREPTLRSEVQIRHSMSWSGMVGTAVAIASGQGAVQVVVALWQSRSIEWSRILLAMGFLFFVILFVMVATQRRSGGRGVKGNVRTTILRRRLCPSCAYALRGVPTSEDGCTVCPECGAAWRLGAEPTA